MSLPPETLEPGEQVLFEGRTHGRPPLLATGDVLFYAQWVFVAIVGAYVWVVYLKRPIRPTGPGLVLSPLALIPFVGALALYQWAVWRARLYVLTDRRFLIVDGVFKREADARARGGVARVRRRLDGTPIIEGLEGGTVQLAGLDDADLEALREALTRDA